MTDAQKSRGRIGRMWDRMKSHVSSRNQSDSGSDVMVVSMIVIPLVIASAGFAVDVSKNVYMSTSYQEMAQQAAYTAAQERNIYGELTEDSGPAFVNEYRNQRGDTTDHVSGNTQTRETQAFRGERCQSPEAGDISEFPRIELRYTNERGTGNFGPNIFSHEGPRNPSSTMMDGYSPQDNYILEATVYDTGGNFFFSLFNGGENDLGCQTYTANASSMSVYEDSDFRGR